MPDDRKPPSGDMLPFPEPGSTASAGKTNLPAKASMAPPFPSVGNRECLRKKLKDSNGSLKEFSDLEQWHWHAYTYAFRRVVLGVSDARSPVDPHGDWFNSRLVDDAEKWMRDKQKSAPHDLSKRDLEAERARNDWARQHGCRDFAHAIEIGIVFVGARGAGASRDAYSPRPAPNQSSLAAAARAALRVPEMQPPPDDPVLAQEARERIGIRLPYADDAQQDTP